jgi:hypothetical protein
MTDNSTFKIVEEFIKINYDLIRLNGVKNIELVVPHRCIDALRRYIIEATYKSMSFELPLGDLHIRGVKITGKDCETIRLIKVEQLAGMDVSDLMEAKVI